jgi:hypothetical protein
MNEEKVSEEKEKKEIIMPFFYEPANKLFWTKGAAQGYTADELKAGFGEWAGKVDEVVKAAEPPPEEPAPAKAPLEESGEYRSSEVTQQ